MVRLMVWRVLALVLFVAIALPARAAEAYQVATISSLLAGGYDGNATVGEMLRHGNFGLGTFNGVDGEMMVLDGRVYRGTTDGRAHLVTDSERTPFAVVVDFHPQGSVPVVAGQSLEQLEVALDALPYSASRILAARIDGRFETIKIRSEPKQKLPYRPLSLIAFRFPAAASSVNVAGWHLHFPTCESAFPRRLRQRARAPNRSETLSARGDPSPWLEALYANAGGRRLIASPRSKQQESS